MLIDTPELHPEKSSPMTHRRAVALMILVTLMWSIAGVVTRHLDAARSFEVNFWRSLFNAVGDVQPADDFYRSAAFAALGNSGVLASQQLANPVQ